MTGGAPGELLGLTDLAVHFTGRRNWRGRYPPPVRAVDGVTLAVGHRETLGLVGESGCGKSTLGNAVLRLVRPTAGQVRFDGRDVTAATGDELRVFRRNVQMIFQDPYSALNPKLKVGESVGEPLLAHGLADGEALGRQVNELLDLVGLPPERATRYPHEFSGGQRQRLVIARALALRPKLIVCDEPVSALDVSIRSQILNLLMEFQQRLGLSYLFISHDLSVVRHISHRVAVMYLGRVVELAPRDNLFREPLHPYTEALISAIPLPDPIQQRKRHRIILKGELPKPTAPPPGCPFHTRCPIAQPMCREKVPPLEEKRSGHWAACHLRN
ncbi:MAG: ABC transporter ATP-binding protein [Alphaproteobacteria bacterium]|nr:ABC transporter ATP-binding protein [Alphaproteobacteria bacterium]